MFSLSALLLLLLVARFVPSVLIIFPQFVLCMLLVLVVVLDALAAIVFAHVVSVVCVRMLWRLLLLSDAAAHRRMVILTILLQ